MKASELRIGNLVMFNSQYDALSGDGNWHEINLEAEDFLSLEELITAYEPIPLTEEWLEKFGFDKVEDLGDMVYYEPKNSGVRRYGICYNHEEWQFMLIVKNEYTTLIYDEDYFQYVHQLQNLVFALTGKELELKE